MPKKEETAVNAVAIVNKAELPQFIPDMDKKELYNAMQESSPIADICDKEFTVVGVIVADVEVARENEEDARKAGRAFDPNDTVTRKRMTLIADVAGERKIYHSFSNTFNKALENAFMIFGDDFKKNTYVITKKSKGMKQYYSVKVK